ncbi:hypothetical protein BV20DRAFT_660762 [Pilatotrama ljubarskyi]|nr:hypothetical protein BV20DRAFT_660762 [Pilatotrama ljubarskyi]
MTRWNRKLQVLRVLTWRRSKRRIVIGFRAPVADPSLRPRPRWYTSPWACYTVAHSVFNRNLYAMSRPCAQTA